MGTAKLKKACEIRVRSHLWEWEDDIICYLRECTSVDAPDYYTTQKLFCEEIGIPKSTLNKLLSRTEKILPRLY